MASLFDELEAASQAEILRVNGDAVRIWPKGGDFNYGGGSDQLRQPVEIFAIFSSSPRIVETDYPGTQLNGAGIVTAPAELWIDREAAAALPYALKRGDVIELIGKVGSPKFIIMSADPNDTGDIRVMLTK